MALKNTRLLMAAVAMMVNTGNPVALTIGKDQRKKLPHKVCKQCGEMHRKRQDFCSAGCCREWNSDKHKAI